MISSLVVVVSLVWMVHSTTLITSVDKGPPSSPDCYVGTTFVAETLVQDMPAISAIHNFDSLDAILITASKLLPAGFHFDKAPLFINISLSQNCQILTSSLYTPHHGIIQHSTNYIPNTRKDLIDSIEQELNLTDILTDTASVSCSC